MLRGFGLLQAAGGALESDLTDGSVGVPAEGFDEGAVGVYVQDAAGHGDGDDPIGEMPSYGEDLSGD